MPGIKRPVVVSTRTTRAERALIQAAAEEESVTVAELLHRILVPAVRDRLALGRGWQEAVGR